jgi:hypothetical protein
MLNLLLEDLSRRFIMVNDCLELEVVLDVSKHD